MLSLMPQSLTNFDNALKDNYGPGLRNAINNSNPVLTEVVRNDQDIVGRKAVWSVHSGRSTSTGARGELTALPSADRQRYLQPEDTLAYLYHTVKVSGQAKHLTRNDTGAFARALESELKGAERDLKNDLARQMFNQAKTINSSLAVGALATVAESPSGALSIDDDGSTLPSSIMRHFFVGEKVDFVDPTTGAINASDREITAIDTDNKTITVDSNASIQDNDYIFRQGNYASGDAEINGLRYLINDSQTYAGIDPTSQAAWKSITHGSSSTGISEVVLDEAAEKVMTDGNGDEPNLWVAEHAQRRKLAQLLQAQKRYDGRQTTLTAGWKGLSLEVGTLVVDRYCPTTQVFGLTTSELAWFVGLDWTWDEDDGKVLYKALDNSDAVEARFKGYVNLNATNRNSHVKVTLSEPSF